MLLRALALALLLLVLAPLPVTGQVPTTRTAKGDLFTIVIPVEFTDLTHTETIQMLNQTMGRTATYYSAASFGQAVIKGSIFPSWIRLSHPLSYYGADKSIGDDAAGNPRGSEQLIIDAVSAAEASVDLSIYRFVIVVHAGADQATASPLASSPLIWSRTWIGRTFLPAGSDAGSIVSEFSPYGVWVHEFGHQTGHLPDMYDLLDSSMHYMGTWSLMDLGAYLGQPVGNQPGLFDAWSRVSLGWITPTTARNGDFSLIPAETSPTATARSCCYALEIPIDSSSYYMVELRLRQGIDSAQRTEGVVIYLYNSTQTQGAIRVVDTRVPSVPSRSDLSDAAFSAGQTFVDRDHNIIVSILSSSTSGYTVHVSSKVSYSLSVILPESVNALTNQRFYVVLNPPIGGLKLLVFLDSSKDSIASSNTTSEQRYNFSLYLQPAEQGAHNLTAALTDSLGRTLASSSVKFIVAVPLWLLLIQPTAVYAYVIAGVLIVILSALASTYRGRKREQAMHLFALDPILRLFLHQG